MTSANMIAPDRPTEAAPLLRREFALDEGHGAVELRVEVTVPVGAEAVLRLRGLAEETVPSGIHERTIPAHRPEGQSHD